MLSHEFKLRPSKLYILIMSATLICSFAILLCLPIQAIVKIIGLVLLSIYGSYLLWNNGLLRSKHSVTSLKYNGEGQWQVFMQDQMLAAELLGDSTVTGFVSVLRFRIANRLLPLSCVIFKDALEAERYRHLIVLLKIGD